MKTKHLSPSFCFFIEYVKSSALQANEMYTNTNNICTGNHRNERRQGTKGKERTQRIQGDEGGEISSDLELVRAVVGSIYTV